MHVVTRLTLEARRWIGGIAGDAAARLSGVRRGPTLNGAPLVDAWSLGSIGPETVATLAGLIGDLRPSRVLECGPGLSTVVMARAMEAMGVRGRIVSLEHSAAWARAVDARLLAAGVRDRVDLLVGELRESATQSRWYSCAADAAARGLFDFVFIDGPPATDGRPRRAPALEIMWDAIAPGATIVLDDAKRRGELACIERWRARFGDRLSIEVLDVEKGLCVMEKAGSKPAVRAPAGWRCGAVRSLRKTAS